MARCEEITIKDLTRGRCEHSPVWRKYGLPEISGAFLHLHSISCGPKGENRVYLRLMTDIAAIWASSAMGGLILSSVT